MRTGTPRRDRRPPAERVRARLADVAGPRLAERMPAGYQRLGRVLVLRLPSELRPYSTVIGAAWQAELGVVSVLSVLGPIAGEYRTPHVELIAGRETETEVLEHGVRWTFDPARIMFAAGNRTERDRFGRLVHRGEVVVDLFAGIGYFAIPAARPGRAQRVYAVEKNPVALEYLRANLVRNAVAERVTVLAGDNRYVPLPDRETDRVVLGYLPSAVPWIPRALGTLRHDGGWLHVHLVVDSTDARRRAVEEVTASLRAAGAVPRAAPHAREVKPYGPGRTHVVVDASVRPLA